jgi:hypothetical protein
MATRPIKIIKKGEQLEAKPVASETKNPTDKELRAGVEKTIKESLSDLEKRHIEDAELRRKLFGR